MPISVWLTTSGGETLEGTYRACCSSALGHSKASINTTDAAIGQLAGVASSHEVAFASHRLELLEASELGPWGGCTVTVARV
ncbi:MAG: hypothetical protein R2706_05695 [Acidimicrobiales bacterium]